MITFTDSDRKRKKVFESDTTKWESPKLENGRWKVDICAKTEFGEGPPLQDRQVFVGSRPECPKNLNVQHSKNSCKMTWQEPDNNGGVALTGYQVRYCILDENEEARDWKGQRK